MELVWDNGNLATWIVARDNILEYDKEKKR